MQMLYISVNFLQTMLKLMFLALLTFAILFLIAYNTSEENTTFGSNEVLFTWDKVKIIHRKGESFLSNLHDRKVSSLKTALENSRKEQKLEFEDWSRLQDSQRLAHNVELLNRLGVYSFDSNGLLPETGLNPETDVLLFMPARSTGFDERKAARKIFGVFNQLPGLGWKYQLVFVLGNGYQTSEEDQASILSEAKSCSDMILSQVEDTYMTLMLKEISGFYWITKAFNSSSHSLKWIVKIDDDVLMHPWKFEEILFGKSFTTQKLICKVQEKEPLRNPESKWYVPYFMYPNETYPKYCNGPSYTMSVPSVALILELFTKTFRESTIWFEDLYFTGMLLIDGKDHYKSYLNWTGKLMLMSNSVAFIHYSGSTPMERLLKWSKFLKVYAKNNTGLHQLLNDQKLSKFYSNLN